MAEPTPDPEDLCTLAEVQDRLPFDMSDQEKREAQGAITDLSDDARQYGSSLWTPANAPRQVKNLVKRAAARHMKNYEGFVSSRAGDEAVGWTDRGESAGSAYFTREEKTALARMAFRGGLSSAPISPWDSQLPTNAATEEVVPSADLSVPFPYFEAADGVL